MSEFTIYLGTKNISSWSLRPWLVLMQVGVYFHEVVIDLDTPETHQKLKVISPSAKVPLLKHNDLTIWDSLAICEYLAEIFPERRLWPQNQSKRAQARSICAEIHSGFPELRKHLPVNVKTHVKNFKIPKEAKDDVQRVFDIWEECLKKSAGPFLFGTFTIPDAMYAPVVSRFVTYDVKVPPFAAEYIKNIMELPAMKQWVEDSKV